MIAPSNQNATKNTTQGPGPQRRKQRGADAAHGHGSVDEAKTDPDGEVENSERERREQADRARSGTVAARTRSLRRLNEDRLRTVGSHARLARRHHGCDNGGLICFGGGCRLRWRGFDNNGLGLGFDARRLCHRLDHDGFNDHGLGGRCISLGRCRPSGFGIREALARAADNVIDGRLLGDGLADRFLHGLAGRGLVVTHAKLLPR